MILPMAWYETMFETETWRRIHHAYWEERDADALAESIERVAALPEGARVLDVPCGIGRLAVALAARGHTVVGVDRTESLLVDARAQAAANGVTWRCADMRDLPPTRDFDAAVCWWGSFGYFGDAGDEDFVRAVRGTLRAGARFLIEGVVAETLLPRFSTSSATRYGDLLVVEEREYELEMGLIRSACTSVDGDTVNRWTTDVRLYGLREIRDMLHRSGFGDVRLLNATNGEPFEIGSRARSMVLATAT